jgi:hypothetical protein
MDHDRPKTDFAVAWPRSFVRYRGHDAGPSGRSFVRGGGVEGGRSASSFTRLGSQAASEDLALQAPIRFAVALTLLAEQVSAAIIV